jgi:hypothetical protein
VGGSTLGARGRVNSPRSLTPYSFSYDGAGNFKDNPALGTANSVNEYSNLTYNLRHALGGVTVTQTFTAAEAVRGSWVEDPAAPVADQAIRPTGANFAPKTGWLGTASHCSSTAA